MAVSDPNSQPDPEDPEDTQRPPEDSGHQASLPLGQSVGKYLLIRQLGRGGMGIVYEAFDTLLHRSVALKVLPNPVVSGPELERFLREARAAIRLTHPNVVTTYDVNRAGTVYFIALELVPGGSAQQHLDREGPFAWELATRIAADACRGLQAAHGAGLIHRDVKPANLLLATDGAKLADFGLVKFHACSSTSLTALGHVAGTPHFMSPEQCRSESLDERSDIYSLGATYYALLVGRAPYADGSAMQVMFAHCSRPVPDPRAERPDLPEGCTAILRRAMAKEPANRYATATALLHDLESLLTGPPITATSSSPTRRGLLLATGALVLTGTGLAAYALWPPALHEPPPREPPVPWGRLRLLKTTGQPGGIAFSRSGDRLYWTATQRSGLWHWAPDRDEAELLLPTLEKPGYLAFSPDGRYLALECRRTELYLFRMEGHLPRFLRKAEPPGAGVQRLTFTPAGDQVVVAAQLWDEKSRDRTTLWLVSPEPAAEQTRALNRFGDAEDNFGVALTVACISGTSQVMVGTELGRVLTYDYREQTVLDRSFGSLAPVRVLAVSPTGNQLAIGGGPDMQDTIGVELWDTKMTRMPHRLNRHTRAVNALAFSPDGQTLASGGYDHDVRVWDTTGQRLPVVLKGHKYVVTGLAFSPDGQWLASCSMDDTIRLWPRAEFLGEIKP